MAYRSISMLAVVAVTLAGCAMTPEAQQAAAVQDQKDTARLEKRLVGYTQGKATNCLDTSRLNVDIYGDTLVYRNVGRQLYVNRTSGGCFGLRRDDIIVTRSFGSQLCRGDIVRTVDRTSGFPSGSCAFGDFVPYTKDRRG